MPTPEITGWRTSSRSGPNNGNCVEVGFAPGLTGIRDTKDHTHTTLLVSGSAWHRFLSSIKSGNCDKG